MTKIGFAVLGLGRIGMIHVKNLLLSPRASVKWLVRNDLQETRHFIDSFSLSAQCTTPDRLEHVLEDPGVDAVLLCSPSTAHAQQIHACLQAGKAVFCEKPVTPDIESTQQCYELAERNRKPLFCAFHRRYDPSFRQMRDNIRSGKFGSLRMLKGSSHDPGPSPIEYMKESGGIFVDSTIHDLDMSLWMVGSRPKSIFACGNAFDPEIAQIGDLDLVHVTIKYENGVLSVIDNGRKSGGGYDQRLEAKCEEGHLQVTNRFTTQLHTMTSLPAIDDTFITRYVDAYRLELEHFLDAMEGRCELEIQKADTLLAMKLAQACQESAQKGAPVSLE